MFVKSIKVEKKIIDKSKLSGETQKLLPDMSILVPNYVEIVLESMHIGAANALRRVISDEVPVKAMNVPLSNIITNDVFIVNDFVQSRLRQIPILQSIPFDTKFSIDVSNTTAGIIEVTSADLICESKNGSKLKPKDIMYETFVLTELNPSRYITIKDVIIDAGYNWQYGGYKIATNVALIPLDQQPFDPYEVANINIGSVNTGNINNKNKVKAALADPRKHRLSFHTTGNIDIKELFILACDEILTRLERVILEIKNGYNTIQEKGSTSNAVKTEQRKIGYLQIENEGDTIGELIKRTVNDLFSDVKIITGITNPVDHSLKIQIESGSINSNGSEELNIAVNECIKQFKKIREEFKAAKI